MGQPLEVICKTCKTEYYLGYGGGDFHRYISLKFPSEEHSGHDWDWHCSDHTTTFEGDLYVEHYWREDEPIVKGYSEYKHVDLEDATPVFCRAMKA